jgi:endo-1,4-beta-xylanase
MKTRDKIILTAVLAGCMISVAQPAKADGTGNDHGFYWMLYHSGGSASIDFSGANTYPGNFAASWSGVGDVVAGKGWNPGGYRTVNYNCGAINGYNSLGVYGWTTGPLVEFYITEIGSSANGSYIGSVSSDGHSYNVYHHQQVNQPSIQGTATFWQNISNWGGSGTGSSHAINAGNHFNYWNSHGMNLGSFNLMVLAVEAYGGKSGYCNATVW